MQTKDSDLQLLHQYRGFLNAKSMIEVLPRTQISAFEFEVIEDSVLLQNFPFEEASGFQFLGKRAEVFFKHYLETSESYQDLLYSLQIIDEGITLGEFDFLCKHKKSGDFLHIELVNKIYLYDETLDENPDLCWIGPNRRDRFKDKIDKLRTHQFPLLYHPKAEPFLAKHHINPWTVEQKICFKAILFLPENCHDRFFETNLNAVVGYYYNLKEFLDKKWTSNVFFIPKKINWFTDESINTKWVSYSKILDQIQHFMAKKQSVMLFRKDEDGRTYKCFIVWWTT